MPDDKPSSDWKPDDWRKGGDPFRHQDWQHHGDWKHGGNWNDNKFLKPEHLSFHPPHKQDK